MVHLKCIRIVASLKVVVSLFISLVSISFSQAAFSDEKPKVQNKASVKCHVVLIDGTEDINLWFIPKPRMKNFKEELVGKKVFVSSDKPKVEVFKVHECVLDNKEFHGRQARLLDSKRPR